MPGVSFIPSSVCVCALSLAGIILYGRFLMFLNSLLSFWMFCLIPWILAVNLVRVRRHMLGVSVQSTIRFFCYRFIDGPISPPCKLLLLAWQCCLYSAPAHHISFWSQFYAILVWKKCWSDQLARVGHFIWNGAIYRKLVDIVCSFCLQHFHWMERTISCCLGSGTDPIQPTHLKRIVYNHQ